MGPTEACLSFCGVRFIDIFAEHRLAHPWPSVMQITYFMFTAHRPVSMNGAKELGLKSQVSLSSSYLRLSPALVETRGVRGLQGVLKCNRGKSETQSCAKSSAVTSRTPSCMSPRHGDSQIRCRGKSRTIENHLGPGCCFWQCAKRRTEKTEAEGQVARS